MNVCGEVYHHVITYSYRSTRLTTRWATRSELDATPSGGLWLGVTLVEGEEQPAATAVLGPISQVGGLEGALALFYLGLLHARADRPSAALGAFHRASAIELPEGPLLPALLEAGILASALGQGDLASSYFSALLIRGRYEPRYLSLLPLHALYWFNRALSAWVPRVAMLLSDCPTLGAGATKLSDRKSR